MVRVSEPIHSRNLTWSEVTDMARRLVQSEEYEYIWSGDTLLLKENDLILIFKLMGEIDREEVSRDEG
ncbi:MAG: hypothetical protein QW334_00125 [Thermofilum sp.]